MTPDKTPTDAQLQSAYDSVPAHGNRQDVHIAGLRAVLAKWGTPAPAGVEPVGEIRASSELGVAPYADIWPWLQPGTKLYTADQVQAADSVLEDAARLDFLVAHRAYVVSDEDCCDGYWLRYVNPDGATWVQMSDHATPRAAIDAAMTDAARAAQKEGEKP